MSRFTRRAGKLLLLLLIGSLAASVVSGCWNRRELDTLGIQLGTAIDKVGNQYRVSVQVVIPSELSAKAGGGGRSPVAMYEATAPTVFEAFRKLTETSSRKIYSAHIRVLIIGESLAREGIANVLDLLSRNPEARTDFYLMIAHKAPANQILKILTSLEKIPAENLFYALDTSAKTWAPTTTVTIERLIEQLVTDGISPVLTGVQLEGNAREGENISNIQQADSRTRTRITGLAVFHSDKLVGWLNEIYSKGYNYIMDNVTSTVGHQICPDGGYIVMEVIRSKTKLTPKVVDGKPVIKVKMKQVASVADVECKIDLTKPETIEMLEKNGEKRLQEIIQGVVEHVQKTYNTDIFGFGNTFHEYKPQQWEKWKDDWDELFPQVKLQYDIEVQIPKVGTTNDAFQNYLKK